MVRCVSKPLAFQRRSQVEEEFGFQKYEAEQHARESVLSAAKAQFQIGTLVQSLLQFFSADFLRKSADAMSLTMSSRRSVISGSKYFRTMLRTLTGNFVICSTGFKYSPDYFFEATKNCSNKRKILYNGDFINDLNGDHKCIEYRHIH